MGKRWRVDVFFTSPMFCEPRIVNSRVFRFRTLANLFAWQSGAWSGWRQTWGVIVDQRTGDQPHD